MPGKTPAILATILTVIILIVFGVLSVVTQRLVLNGVNTMSISRGRQGVGTILAGVLAW